MHGRFAWFIICSVALICARSHAADYQLPGRVLRIVDGDSLVLDVQGSQYRIELWGIDAPERNQPWGEAAADQLNRTLTGSFVNIRVDGGGDEGRIAGRLMLRDVMSASTCSTMVWPGRRSRPTEPINRPSILTTLPSGRRAWRGAGYGPTIALFRHGSGATADRDCLSDRKTQAPRDHSLQISSFFVARVSSRRHGWAHAVKDGEGVADTTSNRL